MMIIQAGAVQVKLMPQNFFLCGYLGGPEFPANRVSQCALNENEVHSMRCRVVSAMLAKVAALKRQA
jgi:hypothetical protein